MRYAVAVLSFFNNKVFIVESKTPEEAILNAIIDFCKEENTLDKDMSDWIESCRGLSVEDLILEMMEGELVISVPVLIEDETR